jgi:hypothetical protein
MERNGALTTTEVEVPAAREAMAMGIATGTVTGMVMDVVTETAMAMAMEIVTEMAMCLVVEEVEVEEVPQPVVAEVVVVEVEEEVVVGAEAAVLEEVAVAAVVVDMIFASTPRIVQVLIGSHPLDMSLQLALNILVQCCIPSTLNFVLDLIIVTLISLLQLNCFDIDTEDDVRIQASGMDQLLRYGRECSRHLELRFLAGRFFNHV